ncbi:sentrin-specific protease 5 [Salmo trutta]|uniref:sentrin-specific protease 5 n=1 Tax=Salmo trutta TaxID=8032 RepID=UPI00113020AB|nr:sentrin-specific protease 5-like [Salmo trutta]XP_029564013.1 sentrin-specific protease 5-like [Salmo trutta]XP_029564014.1 sentrin-specific protease 5-like [Salmo trutta]XP_029564016.1 sentrin-specific protease 5-like [Salmo trutta]XP_029564017.1 sentrin-specific protease 5-like [Salmo trutta]
MVHNVSVPQTPPPALVGTNGRSSGRKRTPKACDCCGPNSKHHNGKDPHGKSPGGKPRQRRAQPGKGRGQALGETPKRTGGHHSSEKTLMTEEQVTAIQEELEKDSVVEEVTNSLAPPVTNSVGQPLTDSMGQPLMNSMGQKLTYTVVKLVTKSVVQPVTTAMVQPVTNSVVQPIMKAVVEHVPDSEMEQENGCGGAVCEGEQAPGLEMEQENGCDLDKQPVTDSNTEVMKQPRAGDAAVSLSNGTSAVLNEEPTDCSAPMEVEPSATACVSPGIMLCSTLHPFALWDHRDYCEVGVWAPSHEPEEDCVSDAAQQPNSEDDIHEVIIDLIHEFLAFFYVKYGSFIPLSETDVLEHLKNKCSTVLHDKKLNIHSEMMKYKAALVSTPMKCFKVDYNKHTLTLEDLSTLDDQNWVNDQVINMYGELIMEATQNKVHFFNSFFHRQLVAKGYEGVKRWTKKVDLFSKRLLLIPIHLEIHWSLITVDIASHHIHYYDSQGIVFKYTMENILSYILAEAEEKKQAGYQKGWKMTINKGIPQQKNDSDCGVFILEYCKCLALKEPLQFTQDDMPKVRKRIYKELCDCKLND